MAWVQVRVQYESRGFQKTRHGKRRQLERFVKEAKRKHYKLVRRFKLARGSHEYIYTLVDLPDDANDARASMGLSLPFGDPSTLYVKASWCKDVLDTCEKQDQSP